MSSHPPAFLSPQISDQLSEVCVKGSSMLTYAVEAGLAVMVDAVASHFRHEQVVLCCTVSTNRNEIPRRRRRSDGTEQGDTFFIIIHKYSRQRQARLKFLVAVSRTPCVLNTIAHQERDIEVLHAVLVSKVCCRIMHYRRSIGVVVMT